MKTDNKIQDDAQSLQTVVSVLVTDLRIGNKLVDKDNEFNKVIGIVNGAVFLKNKYEFVGCPVSWCEPIIITEQWLLNFGFKNENYGWDIQDFGLFDHNYKNGKKLRLALNASPVPVTRIKYVHQLQNLYFALTGRELTEH